MADDGARLMFLGERALAEGFALIGFETWPDASIEEMDAVLETLRHEHRGALVIIDQGLAGGDSRLLPTIHAEARHVAVIETPPLARPEDFHLTIDEQVNQLLGERGND